MILVGNQRGGSADLARHLMKPENERVEIHSLRGFLADDLHGAFQESHAVSRGTRCKQHLYSLSLSPPKDAKPGDAVFIDAVERAEERLGLTGQPRAIVFHEKRGADGELRRHAHAVWCRIDIERMAAVQMAHDHRKLNALARDLYREHGWDMPRGFEPDQAPDPLTYSHAEAQQAKRAGKDPARIKGVFQQCWAVSDSQAAFAHALKEHGYILARGDRRGVVAVDDGGEVYAVARHVGIRTRLVRDRITAPESLPDVATALEQAKALALAAERRQDQQQPRPQQDRGNTPTKAEADNPTAERRRALQAEVREARRHLADQIAAQRAQAKEQRDRLRTGWRGVIDRITGKRRKVEEQSQQILQEALQQERQKRLHLVDAQRALRQDNAADLRTRLDGMRRDLREQVARENPRPPDRGAAKSAAPARAFAPDPRQPLRVLCEETPFSRAALARDPALILGHVSKTKAQFGRADIRRALASHIEDALSLDRATDAALASRELVRLDETRFTTRDFQRAEQSLRESAADLSRSRGFNVERRHVRAAIAGRDADLRRRHGASLSSEQVAAIEHVLGPERLASVVGLAGAGKSTLLEAARIGWERQGFRVQGAALSGKAADGLQSSSGIPSRTLAALELSLANGREPLKRGDVLVIDEAGMIGTRQLARIAEACKARDCKLVLVGDPDQLQPIEAGAPFREIAQTHGAARLADIRRQRAGWQREASADLAAGKTDAALKRYSEAGHVHKERTANAAIARLVEDYARDLKVGGRPAAQLALAHRRKDVHALNQGVRVARKESGDLKDERFFETEHGPRAFAAGDRLIFTRNDAELGVRNGMLGSVSAVEDGAITVRLDGNEEEKRRSVRFRPKAYDSFDHGYAVSIHRAQGATVERSYVLSSRSLDRHLAYVAMTRHREAMQFYTAPSIAPRGMSEPEKAPQASASAVRRERKISTPDIAASQLPQPQPSANGDRDAYVREQQAAQASRVPDNDRPRDGPAPGL